MLFPMMKKLYPALIARSVTIQLPCCQQDMSGEEGRSGLLCGLLAAVLKVHILRIHSGKNAEYANIMLAGILVKVYLTFVYKSCASLDSRILRYTQLHSGKTAGYVGYAGWDIQGIVVLYFYVL